MFSDFGMEIEFLEEFTGSNDQDQTHMSIKGRRSKRPRPSSPFCTAVTSSSSTGGRSGSGGGGDFHSATTSDGIAASASTEEDEDMANCLILLAQGGVFTKQVEKQEDQEIKIEKFNSRKFTEMATTTTGKAGFFVYACKTCNRTFPSFQALGGHRASHKKPKAVPEEKKPAPAPVMPIMDEFQDQEGQFNKIGSLNSPPISAQIAHKEFLGNTINSKPKIHECSICGSEFSSGQALGGHMRRHRTPTSASSKITMSAETSTAENSPHDGEKTRNILALDLNLPAPEDDLTDTKFQFSTTQQHLVFSAPALVDCHY